MEILNNLSGKCLTSPPLGASDDSLFQTDPMHEVHDRVPDFLVDLNMYEWSAMSYHSLSKMLNKHNKQPYTVE